MRSLSDIFDREGSPSPTNELLHLLQRLLNIVPRFDREQPQDALRILVPESRVLFVIPDPFHCLSQNQVNSSFYRSLTDANLFAITDGTLDRLFTGVCVCVCVCMGV
jgi:hypothetical protein